MHLEFAEIFAVHQHARLELRDLTRRPILCTPTLSDSDSTLYLPNGCSARSGLNKMSNAVI